MSLFVGEAGGRQAIWLQHNMTTILQYIKQRHVLFVALNIVKEISMCILYFTNELNEMGIISLHLSNK